MAREIFEQAKPHVNLGTLGHLEHGKSTLIAAISNVLAARGDGNATNYDEIVAPPEDRERGTNITTKHVEFETDKRHYSIVDCPDHTDYLKNMITGSAAMDGAILVVDVSEGLTWQIREQLVLARQAGLQAMVVFLNKTDIFDDEQVLADLEAEIRSLMSSHGLRGELTPMISGSALQPIEYIWKHNSAECGEDPWVDKILELLDAIDTHIPQPVGDGDKSFLIPVEGVATGAVGGSQAQGTIKRGRVKTGDSVQIVGISSTLETTVSGLVMFGRPVNEGSAGDNLGLLLKDIPNEKIQPGMVVAKPNSIKAHRRFESELFVLTKDEGGRHTPFFVGFRPQFYIHTTDVTGVIDRFTGADGTEEEMVFPGQRITMSATLNFPVAIEQGMRFHLRESGRTIAVCLVTNILA